MESVQETVELIQMTHVPRIPYLQKELCFSRKESCTGLKKPSYQGTTFPSPPRSSWPPKADLSRVPFMCYLGDFGPCQLSCGAKSGEIITIIANICGVLSLCLALLKVVYMLYFF